MGRGGVVPGAARMRTSLSHGVGLGIATDAAGRCVVTKVLPGGAAAFSGQVHKGDIVLSIDNRPTAGMSEGEIPEYFLGEAGTVVELGLGRPGTAIGHGQRHVRLVRQPISFLDNATPALAPEENGGSGEMAGIGAVLATDANGNLVVSHLVYGGAAAFTKPNDLFGEDRLKKKDQIVAIDGRDVRGMQPVDVRPLLLGPVGSNVALMVKRAKYDRPVEIVLRRRAESMQTQFIPIEPSKSYPVAMPERRSPQPPPAPQQPYPREVYEQPPQPQPEYLNRSPQMSQTQVQVPAPSPLKVGVGLVLKERSDGCHIVKRLKPGQAAAHCGQVSFRELGSQ